jgi:A/G-specific adenine glycosylase
MTFNSLILIWFDKNRRNLPWRNSCDPYQIWLSEIILQQTRVVQGTNYFLVFTEKFPQIKDLANADEQEVLRLWQGLGYYSRARNLHFTAKYIINELNGKFPDNFQDLLKLKGVGEYTAAAIASIAFSEAVPAIDGNVFRVFSRYFNIHQDISLPKTRKYFFELGKEIISQNRPGDFNQAVMELGATVCTPKNPKCGICPVNESCEALKQNTVDLLPVKSKKVKVKNRNFHFLEFTDGENFLLKKRTEKDVWRNLYNFPVIETSENEDFDSGYLNLTGKPEKTFEEIHILTHQKLKISFWRISVAKSDLEQFSNQFGAQIVSSETIDEFPLPRPMEKYLNEII